MNVYFLRDDPRCGQSGLLISCPPAACGCLQKPCGCAQPPSCGQPPGCYPPSNCCPPIPPPLGEVPHPLLVLLRLVAISPAEGSTDVAPETLWAIQPPFRYLDQPGASLTVEVWFEFLDGDCGWILTLQDEELMLVDDAPLASSYAKVVLTRISGSGFFVSSELAGPTFSYTSSALTAPTVLLPVLSLSAWNSTAEQAVISMARVTLQRPGLALNG